MRDANFRGTQRLSRRRKVLTYRSNPAFLSVCLYKSATGMGKTQVRSALCEKLTDADGENGQREDGLISLTTAVICRNAIMRPSLKNVVKSEQRSAV